MHATISVVSVCESGSTVQPLRSLQLIKTSCFVNESFLNPLTLHNPLTQQSHNLIDQQVPCTCDKKILMAYVQLTNQSYLLLLECLISEQSACRTIRALLTHSQQHGCCFNSPLHQQMNWQPKCCGEHSWKKAAAKLFAATRSNANSL